MSWGFLVCWIGLKLRGGARWRMLTSRGMWGKAKQKNKNQIVRRIVNRIVNQINKILNYISIILNNLNNHSLIVNKHTKITNNFSKIK